MRKPQAPKKKEHKTKIPVPSHRWHDFTINQKSEKSVFSVQSIQGTCTPIPLYARNSFFRDLLFSILVRTLNVQVFSGRGTSNRFLTMLLIKFI